MRAAPYQALRFSATSMASFMMMLLWRKSCQSRSKLRVPADDRGWRPRFRPQSKAACQHNDTVRESEYDVHRMLGEQHRNLPLHDQLLDQRDQIVSFARRHASGWLVHQ